VAVNMVWLFAKTTVRASSMPVDLGVPLSRPLAVTRTRPVHTTVSPATPEPAGLSEPAERRSGDSALATTATA
jgi:hypothetical protein